MAASVLTGLGTCAVIIYDADRLARAGCNKAPTSSLHRMTPRFARRNIFHRQNKILPFPKVPPDVLIRGHSSFDSAIPRVHIHKSKTTRIRLHDPDLVSISIPRTALLCTSTQLLRPPTRRRSHFARMIKAETTDAHLITWLAILV